LNISASDSPFDQKKEYYRESDFGMTRSLCEYEKWTIKKIAERNQRLAEIARQIWDLSTSRQY
jgi:hypothetical protein